MTALISPQPLAASVIYSCDELAIDLRDRRPDALSVFGELSEATRDQLAQDAWTVGLRALANAYSAAQEAKLKDVGTALLSDIETQFRSHLDRQHQIIGGVLAQFFDPRDGQVTQRLAAFVDDQGVLAKLLERFLAPQNSVLAEALAQQVGEHSPLLQRLSPTESTGVVKVLEAQVRAVMDEGHAELVRALDPLAEDGAVARFLRSLREELKGADQDRQRQLAAALAALDANDEQSLLSRLVRETHQARQDVLAAVNPDAPSSPMAMLKTSLTKLLQEQAAAQSAIAKQQEERQVQLEKVIGQALVRMENKREQDLTTTRGGLAFEDAVLAVVQSVTEGAPCVLEPTGATAGIGRSKKGDAVVRFTEESAFAGVRVVFEAKQDASYTVQKALDELDAARKNREAAAGVFVMASSHAHDCFPRFARYGNNVLVTWDTQDPTERAYVQAAVLLGLGLVSRTKSAGDEGDVAALHDIEKRDEIRKAHKALDLLLRNAQSTLRAMNVETTDEALETATPIALMRETAGGARLALPRTGRPLIVAREEGNDA